MSFTQDLFTSRRNFSDGSTRVGQEGRIWYDSETGSFRVGDGVNVGGSYIGLSEIHTSGLGLAVNQHTGNVTISSNGTHLPVPGTLVVRDNSNYTELDRLTSNILIVTGNLTVLGNTKFIDQQLLSIQNKTLTLANTTPAPSDFAANGGGLILLGTSNHTILWDQVTASWESSENWNLDTNKFYAINHVPVLTINSVLDTVSTANLAVAGTDVRIAALTGNTTVRNNLHVRGNITVDGNFPIRRDYDYLNFDTTLANPAHLEGRLFYDNTVKALSYYTEDSELTLNIGQETVMRVINLSNQTIFSGNAVYIVGASGDKPRVARALANNIATSNVVGLATTEMTHGDTGYVTINGTVRGLDTSAFAAGDSVYLSTTVAGAYTSSHASHPYYDVHLGYVTRSNPNNGTIEVQIRNVSFDRLMVNGPANFESNVVVDGNLTAANSVTVANTLSVSGQTLLSSAKINSLTSGRVVLAGAAGQLEDTSSLTYNTGTGTLLTTNANLSGTLGVQGATTLAGTLTAGASTLANLIITNHASIGGTFTVTGNTTLGVISAGSGNFSSLAVSGTSAFTGLVTAVDIDATTLDTTGAVSVGGKLDVIGNFAINTNKFTVNATNGNASILGDASIQGNNLNLPNTFFIGPSSGDIRIGQVVGTTRVRNNLEVDGDVMIDGGYLNASTVAFNLLNTTSTIVSAFGAATTLTLAAPSGTTNIRNNLDVDGNISVYGGAIKSKTPSFDLLNTTSLKINAFGAAGSVTLGTPGPNTELVIRNDNTALLGNLQVRGFEITTVKPTFNLFNANVTTLNLGGYASTINIGNVSGIGTTNILHNMYIQGNLYVNGTDVTFNSAVSVVNDPVMVLGGPPPASIDDNKDRGIQFTWHTGTAPRVGFFGYDDSAQEFTFIPNANNIGEIFTGLPGSVRFGAINGTIGTFTGNVYVQNELFIDGGRISSTASSITILDSQATINIGSTTGQVNVKNNLRIEGTSLLTNQTSFNLFNTTASTVNAFGAATLVNIGAATGVAVIKNAITQIDGDLDVRGGDITTNQTTFNLVNTTATTLNIGGAATAITLGAVGGATVNNGTLEVRGISLTTNQSTFNLINTTATTVNFASAASTINMGAAGGTLTIRNDNVVLDGDLQIKGGDLTTNISAFNLVNTNAISVAAFGAATSLIMGATTGTTRIRNDLKVDGIINLDGATLGTSNSSFSLLNINALNVSAFGAATVLTLGATTGATTIRHKLNVNNNIDVTGSVNIDTNLTVDGTVNIDGFVDINDSVDIQTNLVVGNNVSISGILTLGAGFGSTLATFNLLNTFTTTINAFGAASLIEIGSIAGKTSINNELEVEGAALSTSRSSFDLVNTTATTLNFAGAATTLTVGASTGTTRIRNNLDVDLDLNIDGGDLTVSTAVFNLVNTTATTVNAFGAATAITLGATTGTTTIRNDLTVKGSLTVEGTVTTIDSVTVSVDDKNIELGSVTTPTDATADGGGITLRGTTQKTIIWDQVNTNWTSSEHWNIATGKSFKIDNVSMLDATTLGSTVINSSLRTLGTINTGVWQGTVIAGQYGGTGVNNTGKTITLGGNFATTNFNLTLVLTGASTITLPTTGTVATLAEVETFTNKTINLTNNTLTGTLAEFNSALSGADFASLAGTETLTNKSINLANNTLTGTLAEFNTALTGADFASLTGTETLTNKSINLANNTLTGTLAQFNSALSGDDFASLTGTETLTNKSINLTNNTLTGTKAQFDTACSDGNFAYHSDKLDVFAATTSDELRGVISDETGSGKLVFADDATLKNVTITDVIKITPSGGAPGSASVGMIAVANNIPGTGWDPAGVGGGAPYPVFYDGTTWIKMTP